MYDVPALQYIFSKGERHLQHYKGWRHTCGREASASMSAAEALSVIHRVRIRRAETESTRQQQSQLSPPPRQRHASSCRPEPVLQNAMNTQVLLLCGNENSIHHALLIYKMVDSTRIDRSEKSMLSLNLHCLRVGLAARKTGRLGQLRKDIKETLPTKSINCIVGTTFAAYCVGKVMSALCASFQSPRRRCAHHNL